MSASVTGLSVPFFFGHLTGTPRLRTPPPEVTLFVEYPLKPAQRVQAEASPPADVKTVFS